MALEATKVRRQLWELPTIVSTIPSPYCTAFTLPRGGVVNLVDSVITLTVDAIFQPSCTGSAPQDVLSSIGDQKEPFYASTIPQTYVMAATTVISWVLVVMLVITPRTSFLGHPGVSPGFSSGHGIIGGASGGGTSLVGLGSRPWLQKIAALTVAVSLTIATADTFKTAQHQYEGGYVDADVLRHAVLGSMEIRITRVVSDVFLWLAQVQTLIRLFPRHKEKVLIKWIGFVLIILDSTFACLNSFLVQNTIYRPRQFVDAIPALAYLFELALGLLYAAWVIYYAMTKRRYAFYHAKMRNICLIALLSLVAILTPVVFFVTDVSNQDVAGWGDYFRWVGAAAASVVVWEWVERIEALERDEKKDGILGREVFDGDEMLNVNPNDAVVTGNRRSRRHSRRSDGGGSEDETNGNQPSALELGLSGMAQRFRTKQHQIKQHFPLGRAHSTMTATPEPGQALNPNSRVVFGDVPKPERTEATTDSVSPPPPVASPVSRADTASAASTVYVVHYDTVSEAPQPVRRRTQRVASASRIRTSGVQSGPNTGNDGITLEGEPSPKRRKALPTQRWNAMVPSAFKRKRSSPPAEVQQASRQNAVRAASNAMSTRAATPAHNFSRWDVKNRLGVLAAETGERFRDHRAAGVEVADVPITIIPAQPRGSGRTWSPDVTTSVAAAVPSPGRLARDGDGEAAAVEGAGAPQTIAASSHHPGPRSPSPVLTRSASPRDVAQTQAASPMRAAEIPSPFSAAPSSGHVTVIPAPRRVRSPLSVSTSAQGASGGHR